MRVSTLHMFRAYIPWSYKTKNEHSATLFSNFFIFSKIIFAKYQKMYGCQNEGVFIKATKSFKTAVLNQKLHKTPKN